ncbi:UNKNOWN [Stylonychia lemnae]|uniref:BSD domain-containing protein n=1 Tax=Stylonychia lemnae TaxID=5949 RepID=A0A077ZTP4_STYLE|nr:UNKNOWN [Stylonychia lemnae]|eukprot:CDW72894.1 UNKNOWN [Stylonychia lemnae]
MQGLLPQENILEQVNASLRQIEGILLITNVRILWKRVGDSLFQFNENRLHVKGVLRAQDNKKQDRWVLRIEIKGKSQAFNFGFEGINSGVISDRIQQLLQSNADSESAQLNSVGTETIQKIINLNKNDYLKDTFDEFVVQKNLMTEQEFWSSASANDKAVYGIKDNKIESTDFIQAGISNKPFLLMPRQNFTTQKTEFSLEENDCKRLLKEFSELASAYEARVPLRCSEKEFWNEFLSKNFQYKSQIFGGNNPIFVPFSTDINSYEDLYIHNPRQLLQQQVKSEEVKETAKSLDVNYLKNIEFDQKPSGYGTFQNQQEIDNLNTIIEKIGGDIQTQKDKNIEYEIQARKIINKYNQNSNRIIQGSRHERKIEKKDDEQLMLEKEKLLEEHQMIQTPQSHSRPQVSQSQCYTVNEFKNIAAGFAQNLIKIQIQNQTNKIQMPVNSAENFREFHKKLMSTLNDSIKLIDLQYDLDAVKKKIPPHIQERLLYYYKKFNVLFKHCYIQMEKASENPMVSERLQELALVIKEESEGLKAFTGQEQLRRYTNLFNRLKEMYNRLNNHYVHFQTSRQRLNNSI